MLPHGYTIPRLHFLQSWQLYLSSDWAVAARSSWPFRWSPCGPIRLAGLHSVKHESVRHRKLHPFQKMSNSSGRSLLALYCDIILKTLGRGWHMSCGWPEELLICIQSACSNKQHLMWFIKIRSDTSGKLENKVHSRCSKNKVRTPGPERACIFEATLTLNRGRGCCTGHLQCQQKLQLAS